MSTPPPRIRSTAIKLLRVTYSEPIHDSRRRLVVFPTPQRGAQRLETLRWDCEPQPDAQRESRDSFGNRILELYHSRIEKHLHFRLQIVTNTIAETEPIDRKTGIPPTGLSVFLLPSLLCDRTDAIVSLVAGTKGATDAADHIADELCAAAHRSLRYQPGTTTIDTRASQALERGAGICQDFAHLMIALCRAAGIPARYVAGYNPAEGLMHAWVEVLCGEVWLAWDPTHNRRTSPYCIFVACGRDYRDVQPMSGAYHGSARADLRVRCHTRVLREI